MSEGVREIKTGGWTFGLWPGEVELRVNVVELAARIGVDHSLIRDRANSHRDAGFAFSSLGVREGAGWHFTEAGALAVAPDHAPAIRAAFAAGRALLAQATTSEPQSPLDVLISLRAACAAEASNEARAAESRGQWHKPAEWAAKHIRQIDLTPWVAALSEPRAGIDKAAALALVHALRSATYGAAEAYFPLDKLAADIAALPEATPPDVSALRAEVAAWRSEAQGYAKTIASVWAKVLAVPSTTSGPSMALVDVIDRLAEHVAAVVRERDFALAEIRYMLAHREEDCGATPLVNGTRPAFATLTAEGDEARAGQAHATEQAISWQIKAQELEGAHASLRRDMDIAIDQHDWRTRDEDARREIAALLASLAAERRASDRLRHGTTIEGDDVCPDSLHLTEALTEVARLRAEVAAHERAAAVDLASFEQMQEERDAMGHRLAAADGERDRATAEAKRLRSESEAVERGAFEEGKAQGRAEAAALRAKLDAAEREAAEWKASEEERFALQLAALTKSDALQGQLAAMTKAFTEARDRVVEMELAARPASPGLREAAELVCATANQTGEGRFGYPEMRSVHAALRIALDREPAEPRDAPAPDGAREAQVDAGKIAPIPMLIWCPECGARHVDKGDFATKPHHTHSCQGCGLTWRHAVVATVGVQWLPGFKDEATS